MKMIKQVNGSGTTAFAVQLIVEQILEKHFHLKSDAVSIVLKNEDDYFRLVTKPLFIIIKKETSEILFYLKATDFEKISPLPIMEQVTAALDKISLKELHLVQVLEQYANTDTLFSATIPAAGVQLGHYLEEAKTDPNAIEKLANAYRHLAKGLAHLHQIPIKSSLNSLSHLISCKALEEKIDFQKFPEAKLPLSYLQKNTNAFANQSLEPFCLIHMDTSPENMFYDEEKDALLLIDNEKMSIGPIEYDLITTTLSLELSSIQHGLSLEEVTYVTDAFNEAYRNENPRHTIDKTLIHLLSVNFWLKKTLRTGGEHLSNNEEYHKILELTKNYLKKKLY